MRGHGPPPAPIPADSTLAIGAPLFGGALLWRLDTLLAVGTSPQTLLAGARSRVRWVALRAQKGAHVFQVELWAAAQQASAPVPEVAPDTIPLAYMDSLGVLVVQSGKYIKDMIIIGFHLGTSPAARQTVIDAVNGTVVGGYRAFGADGFCYVHIEGGTLDAIWDALDKVRAFPEVVSCGPVEVSQKSLEAYRSPVDGAGWKTWHLDPEHVNETDKTWPFEQIDAPMAWGCTIGSSATQVAVVDQGLYDADNFHKNIQFESLLSPDTISTLTRPHGTLVAGVLAAAGNDSAGSTGVMWNAGLILLEDFLNPVDTNTFVAPTFGHDFIRYEAAAHYVYEAALLGARVINLSMQVGWSGPFGHRPSEGSREDTAIREVAHTYLQQALENIAASPTTKNPLIVIRQATIRSTPSGPASPKQSWTTPIRFWSLGEPMPAATLGNIPISARSSTCIRLQIMCTRSTNATPTPLSRERRSRRHSHPVSAVCCSPLIPGCLARMSGASSLTARGWAAV